MSEGIDRFRIATTYHPGHSSVFERVLPSIDVFELTPDALVNGQENAFNDERLSGLSELSDDGIGFVAHGVGLSIASWDGECQDYFRSLDHLLERLPIEWHSEHLGYTRVNGEFLGTMLPAPRTSEMLEVLITRIARVQERYEMPFLLEHVVGLLPNPRYEFSEAQFLNAIVRETGCGLLLDAYNLCCDEANHGLDIISFLDEIDKMAVIELHIAEGVKHRGFALDVHSRAPTSATLDLAGMISEQCPNLRLVTYELVDEALDLVGSETIIKSIHAIREALSLPNRDLTLCRSEPQARALPEVLSCDLAEMQVGLLDLIKSRNSPELESDSYLGAVESSVALQVVREIVTWWRRLSVTEFCPLTAALLASRSELEDALVKLIGSPHLSPLHDELRDQLLSIAIDHPDRLVSAVARFERVMFDARAGLLGTRTVIDWPTDPYPVLQALISAQPLTAEPPGGWHRVVVEPGQPPQFYVESV